jgi:hypothetical protein
MRGLSIDIQGDQVSNLAALLGATEHQAQAALRSTYGRMGKWLRARALRGLAVKLGIPPKILRARVKTFRLAHGVGSRGEGAKVWFGLRDIALIRLRARESGKGVVAMGGRYVEGAFIANLFGRRQVLKREGKARIPIRVVYAEISEPAQVFIEDVLIGTAEFDFQFFKFLEHELKWRTRILK